MIAVLRRWWCRRRGHRRLQTSLYFRVNLDAYYEVTFCTRCLEVVDERPVRVEGGA